MPTPWEEPADAAEAIAANARRVLTRIAADADRRRAPTIGQAQQWHRDLYAGIARPVDSYAGEIRDSDPRFPELTGYEVRVGNALGVLSAEVPAALARLEAAAQTVAARLDADIPAGAAPATLAPRQLHGVLVYCAFLHGEWVRIHPFANGNGRTARLWANWAALRYGLPPFVTINPRPRGAYGEAAAASMRGGHEVTVALFAQLLRELLRGL